MKTHAMDSESTVYAPAELVTEKGCFYWAIICPYCGELHRHYAGGKFATAQNRREFLGRVLSGCKGGGFYVLFQTRGSSEREKCIPVQIPTEGEKKEMVRRGFESLGATAAERSISALFKLTCCHSSGVVEAFREAVEALDCVMKYSEFQLNENGGPISHKIIAQALDLWRSREKTPVTLAMIEALPWPNNEDWDPAEDFLSKTEKFLISESANEMDC
jgi:hypothetical protein